MKKALFYPALVVLILANVIVYSCQKEHVVTTVPVTTDQEVGERFAPCSPITITNGLGLGICNIDAGPYTCSEPCTGTNTSVPFDIVNANPDNFAFTLAGTFSLMNPTGAPVNVTINLPGAGCAGQNFLIPAWGTRAFKVISNVTTGCCEVVPAC